MIVLGIVLHVWTILIAYDVGGFGSAVLAFILPVYAELYWGYKAWRMTGTILNLYSICVLAYIALACVVTFIIERFKEK